MRRAPIPTTFDAVDLGAPPGMLGSRFEDAMSIKSQFETMVYSPLAGRAVSTWSSEWQRQCEVDYLLSISLERRMRLIDGRPTKPGEERDRDDRPMAAIRGQAGVESLKADIATMERLLRDPREGPDV